MNTRAQNWIGLDVGGANLKLAATDELAIEMPFPLWQRRDDLAGALAALLDRAATASQSNATTTASVALTMTGELADCYVSKREGVAHIVDTTVSVARGCRVAVYLVDGTFVTPSDAKRQPYLAAASNWHALATLVARELVDNTGLLIDIGSTTTDLIPMAGGRVVAQGTNDTERLQAGELVYTGVARTPVCAVVDKLPLRQTTCAVAAELFATTADAYILLGDVPERPNDTDTADGRPLTRACAQDRLARMICADRETFSEDDAVAAARAVADTQLRQLIRAAQYVLERAGRPDTIVLSGQGEWLGRRLVDALGLAGNVISLGDRLGAKTSRVAPAYAVARLAEEFFAK